MLFAYCSLMRAFSWLLAIIVVFIAASCKHPEGLVGEWTSTTTAVNVTFTHRLSFREDGSFTDVSVASSPSNTLTLTSTDTGSWKLIGDSLALHLSNIEWNITGNDPARAARAEERLEQSKSKVLALMNKEPPLKLTWNGNSECSYVDQGQRVVMHRLTQ